MDLIDWIRADNQRRNVFETMDKEGDHSDEEQDFDGELGREDQLITDRSEQMTTNDKC